MTRRVKELSSLEVKRLTEPGLYAVGGVKGLYLKVAPGGSRSWIMRVTIGTRRRDIGLGGYPDVALQEAREDAQECRRKIRQGMDPIDERKALRSALANSQAKQITFREAASRCHAAKSPEFRNVKHRADWLSALQRHAYPVIGSMQVANIELPHVLKVLEPIWHGKTETATRVRQRMEAVLTWATVSGYRTGDNPARWDGNLKEVLPNPSKISKVEHFAAIPWQQMGSFMVELRKRIGTGARALEFAILTAARSGEVRGMTWDEVDFNTKSWVIPEGRIKAGRKHTVPLSDDALSILESMPRQQDVAYVFPAIRGGRLSDVTLLAVVRRMGVSAVPHGFRSSFKDFARNCTNFPDEVSELALAHVNSDSTRAAYARDELIPQRRRLMKVWAEYCQKESTGGNVVSFMVNKNA